MKNVQKTLGNLIPVILATAFYAAVFSPLHALIGDAVTLISIFPVAMAGWFSGILGGLFWSVLILFLNLGFFGYFGYAVDPVMFIKEGASGFISLMVVGAVAGWAQTSKQKVKDELAQRKLSEIALKKNEQRYRSQFENMIEGIAIDEVIYENENPIDWVILDVNPSYEKILGISREKAIGRLASEIYGSKQAIQGFLTEYEAAIKTGKPVRRSTHSLIGNRELSYTVIPIGEKQVVVIFTDITEQLRSSRMEKEQQKMSDALRNIASALNMTIHLDEVLDIILDHMEQFVSFDAADIMLIENDMLRIERHKGYSERGLADFADHFSFSLQEIPSALWMVQNSHTLIIADTSQSDLWVSIPATAWIGSYMGLPIIAKGRMIGILNFLHTQKNFFENFPYQQLQPFAEQVALAIENARIFEETRKRAQRLALINRVASQLTMPADLVEIQQLAVDCVAEALGVEEAGLALLDSENNCLTLVADHPAPGNVSIKGIAIPLENNLSMDFILENKTSFLSTDAQNDPRLRAVRHIMIRQGINSILIVPLIIRGEVIGTMGCDVTKEGRTFSLEEIILAETLTNLVAGRIEQARLLAGEKKRAAELSMLHKTTLAITQPYELSKLLQHIVERAVWLLDSSGGMLYLKLPDEEMLECKVSYKNGYDPVGTKLQIGEGAAGIVAQTGQPLIIANYGAWSEKPEVFRVITEPFGLISVPVMWQSQIKGVIQLLREADMRPFVAEDANLLSLFSSQVAISLENTRLYQEVQKRAVLDQLTGVFNRGGFAEIANREIERAHRFGGLLSLLFLDLDHFKKVNDSYGHPIGDLVLIEVVKRWKTELRAVDVIGRYGGEEFVVLLLEVNLMDAVLIAERLRSVVVNSPIRFMAEEIQITVSIGVAEFHESIKSLDELIQNADQAAYQAKSSGRNCVVPFKVAH